MVTRADVEDKLIEAYAIKWDRNMDWTLDDPDEDYLKPRPRDKQLEDSLTVSFDDYDGCKSFRTARINEVVDLVMELLEEENGTN
jgi:hypothetical protein